MKTTSNKGFTLIEMLVVCLIIVILAGLVFRMTTMISLKNAEAETKRRLEMVANALEEFKAIYGKYPPVGMKGGDEYGDGTGVHCPFYYEYPGAEAFPDEGGEERARNLITGGYAKDERWHYHTTEYPGEDPNAAPYNFFTFGLCSFFVPRVNGTADTGLDIFRNSKACTQWNIYNDGNAGGDSQRDLDAVRRILPHLGARLKSVYDEKTETSKLVVDTSPKDCILSIGGWQARCERLTPTGVRTNWMATVFDPLSGSGKTHLCYWSPPPYETYKLWSKGRDGQTGTDDDVVWGSF